MTTQILHFVKKPNYLKVGKDKTVRLKYVVFDADQDRVIEFRDDLFYLHGGYGGAFPKVETVLEGREVGDRVEVHLAPEEAYGERDESLAFDVPLEEIPEETRQAGARLEGEAPDGKVLTFYVNAVTDQVASVDANHPLAGRRLRMVLEVLDIRPASEEELRAGYAFASTPARSDSDRTH